MPNANQLNESTSLIVSKLAELFETSQESIVNFAMLNLIAESSNNLAVLYAIYDVDSWVEYAEQIARAKSIVEIVIDDSESENDYDNETQ